MNCSCEMEVSPRYNFCPYCGKRKVAEMSQSPGPAISLPDTSLPGYNGARRRGRENLRESATLKESDWSPPLPQKYLSMLERGTTSELVIWEIFKRTLELRRLLEEAVESCPPEFRNQNIERAVAFLQSHCVSCGEPALRVEKGEVPVCTNCEST